MMNEQLSIQAFLFDDEDTEDLMQQVTAFKEYERQRRAWEYAFQKWSDEQGQDGSNSQGCCGYGAMCDYCEDNTYGRPCVRALNAMLRASGKTIDYTKRDFKSIWYEGEMHGNETNG